MQKISWTGALVLLLTSCSAEWHHKQACKKDTTYCATEIRIDTFTIRDTFAYYRVDTTKVVDTITIDTGSVQVQIIREFDVIRTTIKQKPDTAFLTVYKKAPPKIIYKQSYWWVVGLLIVLAIIFRK